MNPTASIIDRIVMEAARRGEFPGRSEAVFRFEGSTASAVLVSRRNGNMVRVPRATLAMVAGAYASDPFAYARGPGSLRVYGVTHINSPVWALVHLLPPEAYARPGH